MNSSSVSSVEFLLLIIFGLIVDALDFIPFVNLISSLAALMITQFYFRIKGINSGYALGGNLLDLIPGLSILPATTAGIIATIVADRRAKTKTPAKQREAALANPEPNYENREESSSN